MSATDPLNDQWAVVLISALISSFLTLLIMALFYALEHPRKKLMYRVLHSRKVKTNSITTRLNPVTRALSRWEFRKVKSGVYELEVKVLNTGRSSLERHHFGSPVIITFGPYCTVLAASVSYADPRYLSADCTHDGKSVHLQPALLNSGNWVRVKAIVQDPSSIRVAAHIAGVKRIFNMDDALGVRGLRAGLLGLLMTLAGGISYPLFSPDPYLTNSLSHGVLPLLPLTPSTLAVVLSLIGGYFMMYAGMSSAFALVFAGWSHLRNRVPIR